MSIDRRRFMSAAAAGFTLTPLAALLAACGRSGDWAEGMAEIKWDRDICVRCSMAISDRRFAAQMRGGPRDTVFKFDDIGCVAHWLRDKARDHPWMADVATRIWVADMTSRADGMKWLDAKKAQYIGGKTSPMGYNFGAVAMPQPGSLDFATMREHVLAKGK
ncbi:MAG: nitrous oxide reductase accessory protein NosL [Beijerinckiaceae bacterium]|nr:nitrous oxide reductase accessory protein NosL [Beijerinckiaceae bacterium]